MKKILAALAIGVGLLTMTGCATIAAQSGQEEIAVYDERALLTAEVAYGVALESIATADAFGLITPAVAEVIVPKLEAAQAAIDKARALYDANRLVEAGSASDSAVLQVAALLQVLIDVGIVK
jgi:hypothetical protein